MARTKTVKNQEAQTESNTDPVQQALDIFEELDGGSAAFKSRKTIIETIDTGSPAMNNAIGIGGYPKGRIVQIYGPFGSGKSLLSMEAVANAVTEPGSFAVWFDAEHSFNYTWAKEYKIWDDDPKKSKVKVYKGARGIDIIEKIVGKIKKDKFGAKKVQKGILDYVKEGKIKCPIIVIDSLGSIISPAEEDAPVGGRTVGALAGFLSAELKRMGGIIEETNTCLICLNQVRQSLDIGGGGYGDKFHFPGGENLKHQMSLNLYIERRTSADDIIFANDNDKNTLIGQKVKVVVKKSRFGPSPRTCETTLLFKKGAGFDKVGVVNVESEVLDLAGNCGLITKSGAWITLHNGERFCGIDKTQEYLKNNKDVYNELVAKLKDATIKTGEIEEVFADDETLLAELETEE